MPRVIFTPVDTADGIDLGPCFVIHDPIEEAAIERGESPENSRPWISIREAEQLAREYGCDLEVV